MGTTINRSRRAFTLIELLVVVAILAILMTMLLPYLTRARDIAKRVICEQNQRTIATAVQAFSAAHNGRSPGGGVQTIGNNNGYGWSEIMSVEWFKESGKIQCTVSPRWPSRKSSLTCPSFMPFPGWGSADVYQYNRAIDASTVNTGVSNIWPASDAASGGFGLGGLAVDPKYVNYVYQQVYGTTNFGFGNYFLGAQFEKIVRPNYVYQMIETDAGGNNSDFDTNVTWGATLVLNTGIPKWAVVSARNLSFRHCLPPDPTLYQKQATAVYTYADSHVEVVNTSMPILDWGHYVTNGRQPGT